MEKQQIIDRLQLEPHVEGGYFKRIYASTASVSLSNDKERALVTSIYYMLTEDNRIGRMHRNESDIIHYFLGGSPLSYTLLSPQGELIETILGNDLSAGQKLTLIVKGGYWKATELMSGSYGLIAEAVTPGFDYDDMELAAESSLQTAHPELVKKLKKFL